MRGSATIDLAELGLAPVMSYIVMAGQESRDGSSRQEADVSSGHQASL